MTGTYRQRRGAQGAHNLAPVVVGVIAGTFGVASAACGLAPGIGMLVGARVAQGVGSALLLPGTLAIVTRAFPHRAEQARAIGIWAGVGSVALPAGPLLGGALVTGVGWRAVFWLNVPVVAVAAVAAARVVTENRVPAHHRLDRAGIVFGGLALAAGTFAVIDVGHVGLAPPVIVAAVLAAAAATGFWVVERRVPDPMVPFALLRRPAFSTANAVAGAMNLGTLGLLFLLTLYLQTVQHRSALAAGIALLPLFAPLAVLAPLAGRVTARLGPSAPMTAGLLLAALGVALLAPLQPASAHAVVLTATLAWGTGLGMLTPAVVAAAVGAVPPERAGLASAMNNTSRQAGGVIGIAAYGAIAGSPRTIGHFLTGLHATAMASAALFLAAAVATFVLIRQERAGASQGGRK